jgi:hypothetical protein
MKLGNKHNCAHITCSLLYLVCYIIMTQQQQQVWINPSKSLVDRALDRWSATRLRADNTSVVTLMLDPPGPPRAQVRNTQR